MTDRSSDAHRSHRAGLSAAEAAVRARLISVSSYEIALDITGLATSSSFTSRTVIRFSCREAGAHTWVDLIAREVHRVNLNGIELDPDEIRQPERLELRELATENTLIVEAAHEAATGAEAGRGISRSVDPGDGEIYVWSQFEAFDARRAYACFDQPDLKATFSSSVRAPMRWECVSNGKVSAVTVNGTARVWHFARTPRLPTYVTAFCAGPFEVVGNDSEIPEIKLYARRSLAPELASAAPELIGLTRDGLAHYGARFGMSYAGDSYDYVFLPDFGGAMENFGCVTWTDEILYRYEPTPHERRMRQIILLHEMAHMWFGNLVTMRWWDGLWLNESFADWAAFWTLSCLEDSDQAWSDFLLLRKQRGYVADQSPTTHPISGEIADIEAAEASVDMITYAKGAAVLRQLVAVVGEDRFLTALRRYFARFAWQNTEVRDLLTELENASGQDLSQWAAEWLHTAGPSTLTMEVAEQDGSCQRVRLRQTGPAGDTGSRRHRLNVGVYDDGPDGRLRLRQIDGVRITDEAADLPSLAGAPSPRLLLPNEGDLTFAKFRLDARSLGALLSPRMIPTILSRAVAVQTLWDMMMDAELASSTVIDAIVGCIAEESEPATLWQLITLAEDAATVWTPPAARAEELAKIADVCLAGLRRTEPGQARARSLTHGFVRTATTDSQLEKVGELLADQADDRPLRWSCLLRLVAADRVTDEVLEKEAGRDPDPDARSLLAITRSARGSHAAKEHGLALMLGERPLAKAQRQRLATAFWQPLQIDLLTAYADRYVDRLQEAGNSTAHMSHLLAADFPLIIPTDELINRVKQMIEDEQLSLRVRRTLADRADIISRAQRAFRKYPPVPPSDQ